MMVDKPEVAEHEESAADLRNKLIKRLAVAGVLVAVLLGVLAFFDYLATPSEEPEEPVFSQPVPVAPKKPLSQPVTPASEAPEAPATAPGSSETLPPPKPAAQPALTVDEKPAESVRHEAPPAKLPSVEAKPSPVPAKAPPPVPEATAAPTVHVAAEPVVKPAARVVEPRPAPPPVPSGVSRLFSGFLLQAGVFTSPQRAEELHAKLTLSGVPSTLETRVQVGPFRTRQEAEAAQAKLRELGIESVMLSPKSGKN
jgi:DedD protein